MTSDTSTDHLPALQDALKLIQEEKKDEAVEALEAILKDAPQLPEAVFLLGICSLQYKKAGQALKLFTTAHELDPECRDYVDALASLKAKLGDLNDSLYFAKLAVTLDPHPSLPDMLPETMRNYAESLITVSNSRYLVSAASAIEARDFVRAIGFCNEEIHITPHSAEAHYYLGVAHNKIGDYEAALSTLHKALALKSNRDDIPLLLADCLIHLGRSDEALTCLKNAMATDPEDITSAAAAMKALSYQDAPRWEARGALEAEIMRRARAMDVDIIGEGQLEGKGKIRIGFLCDELYSGDHILALASFLDNRERNRTEIYIYQQSITSDGTTRQITSSCDSTRAIYDLDDFAVTSIMSGDGLHVLFDLTGHNPGQRLAALCAKPAPLQVAWLNHLDGTKEGVIDLIVADETTQDIDTRTACAGQDIATLSDGVGLFAFPPFTWMKTPSPLPANENGNITFGAYADLATMTPDVVQAWCAVLSHIPNALLVLNAGDFATPVIRRHMTDRFAHFAMAHRLAFLEPASVEESAHDKEQTFLDGIDILLDAPSHSNPTRVARALWAGVPVLTLSGERRSEMAATCALNAAGKGEWAAKDVAGLIQCAVDLCSDLDALTQTRAGLRSDIEDSALFDEKGFARRLVDLLEGELKKRGVL